MKGGEAGRFGENEACRYLIEKGYEILARNYRSRYGEIDIIAQQDGAVVFVDQYSFDPTLKSDAYVNASSSNVNIL